MRSKEKNSNFLVSTEEKHVLEVKPVSILFWTFFVFVFIQYFTRRVYKIHIRALKFATIFVSLTRERNKNKQKTKKHFFLSNWMGPVLCLTLRRRSRSTVTMPPCISNSREKWFRSSAGIEWCGESKFSLSISLSSLLLLLCVVVLLMWLSNSHRECA